MIRAYLDESGIGRSDEVCIVAGWIGSTRQWAIFEDRWQRASKGVVFHGTEFFSRDGRGHRVGPYAGWTDDHAKEYIDGLLSVLERGNITAFGTMVDVRAFMELSETQRHYLTGRLFHRRKDRWTMTGSPNSPYFLGFTETLVDIAERVKKPGWLVDLVCDRQENYASHATNVFDQNKKHVSHLSKVLGEIGFENKANFGALQAADMLAHTIYRRWHREVGESDELDSVTIRLRPLTHRRVRLLDAKGLRFRLENVPPEVAAALDQ